MALIAQALISSLRSNFLLFRNLPRRAHTYKVLPSWAPVKHRLSYVSDIIRKGVIFYWPSLKW